MSPENSCPLHEMGKRTEEVSSKYSPLWVVDIKRVKGERISRRRRTKTGRQDNLDETVSGGP